MKPDTHAPSLAERLTEKEKAARRRMERCEHFTGIMNKTCKAGHAYDEFKGGLPCIASWKDGQERPPCADRLLPTLEQLAERDREMKRWLENMAIARRNIMEYIDRKGRRDTNFGGTIACQACPTGELRFTYAGAYNGHVHAHCTTEGCLSWME